MFLPPMTHQSPFPILLLHCRSFCYNKNIESARSRTAMIGSIFSTISKPFTSRLLYPLISKSSSSSSLVSRSFSNDSAASTPGTKLTKVATLVEGCDYEHWLVVTNPPKGYPLRDEIIDGYIKSLATALGSEEEAKKSIYSVSTKYYYAFGCKVAENLTHKIKSLPNVRWILPDCYLNSAKNDYGGEPFIDGKAVPYEEMYHASWLHDQHDANDQNQGRSRKTKRKEKKRKIDLYKGRIQTYSD